MTRLEDRLRDHFRDEVAGLDVPNLLPAVLAAGRRARIRQRLVGAACTAALTAAVTGGAIGVRSFGLHRAPRHAAAQPGTVLTKTELAGGGIEEPESGEVDRRGRVVEGGCVEGAAERGGGEDVEASVADEGGNVGHPVEDELDAGPDLLRAATAGIPGRFDVGGTGEVGQVQSLGLVELQRASDCVEHAFGDAGEVALLQAGVVVGTDPGEHRDLLAA